MEAITVFKTLDGKTFPTQTDAKIYLDKIYSDLLFRLSHGMSDRNNDKRQLFHHFRAGFIDEHLADFVQLKAIRDDMILLEGE